MTIYQYGNNNPIMLNDPLGELRSGRLAAGYKSVGK
jgi:hypothetical protein